MKESSMKTYTTKTGASPSTHLRKAVFGGCKKTIICLATVLAVSVPASARDFYANGDVLNWETSTHDSSFSIENGTTVNIKDGVTISLRRSATYDTSYLATDQAKSAYLNLSGSGRIEFEQEMAFALSDASGGPGIERILNMSGKSYMNPSTLYVGQRGDAVINITDDAMIDIRTDGALYTPNIIFGNNHYGFALTATINQSGNSIIQSLASGMKMGANNTAIYNMSGGQLILGGNITGAGVDDKFNFTGGKIILKGGDYTSITNAANSVWFSGGIATFDGTDTTVLPKPRIIPPPELALNIYPGLNLTGTVGRGYRVEYANVLTPNTWVTLTTINLLTTSPTFVIDPTPGTLQSRFYRAVQLP